MTALIGARGSVLTANCSVCTGELNAAVPLYSIASQQRSAHGQVNGLFDNTPSVLFNTIRIRRVLEVRSRNSMQLDAISRLIGGNLFLSLTLSCRRKTAAAVDHGIEISILVRDFKILIQLCVVQ